MPDEEPINWDVMRGALVNIAEIIWTYHQALLAAGFDETTAYALTVAYQAEMIKTANS